MELSSTAKPSFGTGFSAIFRIFTNPSTVYGQIRDGLSVWPGLIVWIVVVLLISLSMGPVLKESINASIAERGADPGSMGFIGPLMVVSQVLGQLLALVIIAFFYWLALLITFGSVPFGRVFALTVYVGFVGLLYQVINGVYLLLTRPEISDPSKFKDVMLDLSLGALFSEGGFVADFLSQLGLFQIWGLVLMIAGAAVLTGRSRKQTTWPVLIVFLLGSLLAAALAGMGSSFGS